MKAIMPTLVSFFRRDHVFGLSVSSFENSMSCGIRLEMILGNEMIGNYLSMFVSIRCPIGEEWGAFIALVRHVVSSGGTYE